MLRALLFVAALRGVAWVMASVINEYNSCLIHDLLRRLSPLTYY